ncbi:MAG: cellulase family glycosylhydrolase [Isosphaeraceae bacterium]
MKFRLVASCGLLAWLAAFPTLAQEDGRRLDRIRPSPDGSHFVREGTGERFVVWGVNYDHDDAGRLLEDYWADEWETVAEDFREIRDLGANLVRIHLQLGKFLDGPDRPNRANLDRLAKLVKLADDTGLYLDITGLGCYHKQDTPAWYDALDESARWDAQARFWKAVAAVGKGHAAVFCYDLMNEPLLGGGEEPKNWTPGKPLGGKYFVQRITNDVRGRDDRQIAKAWVSKLCGAIRSEDDRAMITVGVIPWAQVFPGAKDPFHSPEAGGPLDFVSIHVYPRKDKLDEDLKVLKGFEAGKPILIEEIFPLSAGIEATEEFIEKSREVADGWVSFYWGRTIEECEAKKDLQGAIVAAWLRRFRELSKKVPGGE